MRLCLLTTEVSPHQIPLARCLARLLGADGFRYVAAGELEEDRRRLGWDINSDCEKWILHPQKSEAEAAEAERWTEQADVLLSGIRDVGLMARRVLNGRLTLYMSERWFKPPVGIARLLHPRYFLMAWSMTRLLRSPFFYYFPMGRYAAGDMSLLMSLFRQRRGMCGKQRLWGYFVEESESRVNGELTSTDDIFQVLWFGRLLKLKRVDTLIRAVSMLDSLAGPPLKLKIIGTGPEENALRELTAKLGMGHMVEFVSPVPIDQIRDEIKWSDVGVVTSNGQEGWGVAVNEIMLEERCAIISDATGAGATMIQSGVNGLLFKSGNCDDLACQLRLVREDCQFRARLADAGRKTMLDEWAPEVAAARLIALSDNWLTGRALPQWESGPLSVV